jgi:hypothetical protein
MRVSVHPPQALVEHAADAICRITGNHVLHTSCRQQCSHQYNSKR